MANDTSTAGFLTSAIPDDKALRDFFQVMIKGITGLDGTLVRPSWQPNPPKQPVNGTNWCAFGWKVVKADANAEIKTNLNGLAGILTRNEDLEVLATFYGSSAYGYAAILRDGLEIAQNRDTLRANGIAFKGEDGIVHNPELINDVWYDRQDLTLKFSREINRVYGILSFEDASGLIVTDNIDPLTREFETVLP